MWKLQKSWIFGIDSGYEKVSDYNITNNMCNAYSAYAHEKNRYDDILFKNTNIRNNTQTYYPVFGPQSATSAKVYTTSIIYNKRDYYQLGIINAYKHLLLENCCILGNEIFPLFSCNSEVRPAGVIIVKSCYFDSDTTDYCQLVTEEKLTDPFDIEIITIENICVAKLYKGKTFIAKESCLIHCSSSFYTLTCNCDE